MPQTTTMPLPNEVPLHLLLALAPAAYKESPKLGTLYLLRYANETGDLESAEMCRASLRKIRREEARQ